MPLTQTASAPAADSYDRTQAAALQMHGQDWDGGDLTGWVVTEKMDGCRAYWDGRTLYTKSGNVINAPAITARLPEGMHLDGEIWAGRGRYETARRFVQYGQHADEVAFVAFDAPRATGGKAQRLDAAKRAGVRCVQYRIVRSMSALREQLKKAIAGGAEGLMACRPDAPYRAGRGDALVKLKQHSLELFSEAPDPANDRHQPINPQPAPCGLFLWSFKKMPLTQPTRADACTRKTRKPKPAALPFHNLPTFAGVDDVNFWLIAWSRDLAMLEALDAHTDAAWSKIKTSEALARALTTAVFNALLQVHQSLEYIKTVGGLLFAFVGTTKLQQVAA